MYRNVFFSLLLLSIISCSKDTTFIPSETRPALVAWGMLEPDSLAAIRLSHTFPLLSNPDTLNSGVSGALVLLFNSGVLVDTLQDMGAGVYRSASYKPVEGGVFHITAEKPGYPKLSTAPDSMPLRPTLESVEAWLEPGASANKSIAQINVRLGEKTNALYYRMVENNGATDPDKLVLIVGESNPCSQISVTFPKNPYGYNTADLRCIGGGDFLDLISNQDATSYYAGKDFLFSVTYASQQSLRLFERLSDFEANNINPYTVNIFFTPVYIPNQSVGGYGFITCFNPAKTIISF